MSRLFDPDAPLMRFLSRVADLMILNILWIILCIPVVTAGAATTALYRVCLNIAAQTDASVIREFFRTFRREFKPATLVWLVLLIPTALCAVNLWLLLSGRLPGSAVMPFICLLPLLLLIFLYAYVFAYVAMFRDGVLRTLRNALLLSIANLPRTILMAVLNLLPVILFLTVPEVFFRMLIVWLLVGFALAAYLNSRMLWKIFKKIAPGLSTGAAGIEE